jgi:phage tail-like protein
MRTTVPDLPSSLPISDLLPGVFIEHDPVLVAFTTGLDDTLAPIPGVLDSLAAYIDPQLAPADFLGWLATWVGIELDEAWPIERKREAVAHAVEIYQHLGTEAGLRRYLELATEGHVEIHENGGIAVSQVPDADLPGDPIPRVNITVSVTDPSEVDLLTLERIVSRAKPAWVTHSIEVVAS